MILSQIDRQGETWDGEAGQGENGRQYNRFEFIYMYSAQMPIHGPGDVALQFTIERVFRHRNSLNHLPLMWTWRYMMHSGQHGNKDVVQAMLWLLVFVQLRKYCCHTLKVE